MRINTERQRQGRGPICNTLGLSYMPGDCTDLSRQILEPADLATRALCTNEPSTPLRRVTGNTATACEDHLSPFLPGPPWLKKMGRKTKIPSVTVYFHFGKGKATAWNLVPRVTFLYFVCDPKTVLAQRGKSVSPLGGNV